MDGLVAFFRELATEERCYLMACGTSLGLLCLSQKRRCNPRNALGSVLWYGLVGGSIGVYLFEREKSPGLAVMIAGFVGSGIIGIPWISEKVTQFGDGFFSRLMGRTRNDNDR